MNFQIKTSSNFIDFINESLLLYSFLNYLKDTKTLNIHFHTPLEIKKRESPDFVIKNNTGKTGIEICSGSPQNMHYVSAIREEFPEESLIELDPNLFNKKKLTCEEVKSFIKAPNVELSAYPWIGYTIEFSWAKNIYYIIQQKTAKLNNRNVPFTGRKDIT